MNIKISKFHLYRSDTLLGTITHNYDDFPWHHGTFEPTSDFYPVRELFDRERSLLEKTEFDSDSWEKVWEEINQPGLRLVPIEGKPVTQLLIHIDGTETWWRCCEKANDELITSRLHAAPPGKPTGRSG